MKKLLYILVLISATSFAQQEIIQQELTATDTIKSMRLLEIRKVIDKHILSKIPVQKDTVKLEYYYKIDVLGSIILKDSVNNNTVKFASEVKEFFKNSYKVRPYNDFFDGIQEFKSELWNSYLYTDGAYEIIKRVIMDKFPVYSGCESFTTIPESRHCMNRKIAKHIGKNFNTELANTLGLRHGKKRIYLQFIIDEKGSVSQIKARAPHPRLKAEGIRIVKLLPHVKPGELNGKKVKVTFSLPITFMVEEDFDVPVESDKDRKKRMKSERKELKKQIKQQRRANRR